MKTIKDLQAQIESELKKSGEQIAEFKAQAAKLFAERMRSKSFGEQIEALDKALCESRELTDVLDDEWVHRWIRFDASTLIDTDNLFERELLTDYLRENYFIELDFDNNAASTPEGPCLIINDEGDVFDQESGKWVIKRADYLGDDRREDYAKRNALIKAYMKNTGRYPSVVRYGRYGVEGYVDLN
jgi:hypothetical protein